MKSQVASRFIECLEELKSRKIVKSNRQFAIQLNYLPQSLSEIIKGRRNVPLGLLEKAIEVFDMNPGYLFLGHGYKFLNVTITPIDKTVSNGISMGEALSVIDFVPFSIQESYCQHVTNVKFLNQLPKMQLPQLVGADSERLRAFEVIDPQMSPVLHAGDYVIGQIINPVRWASWIGGNKLFVIVTKTGIIVRKIVNRILQEQCLILHTIDEQGSGYRIELQDVRQIYQVTGLITKQIKAQDPTVLITKQIKMLKQTIQAQQKQLDSGMRYMD